MLKPCKDCGTPALYKPRRAMRCNPCKARMQRDYCARVGYHKARYARLAESERERHLVRKYGVTLEAYETMLVEQGHACAICRRAQERALDVDHDHTTGAVRGLLCTSCNRMLGHSGDAAETLEAGAAYLRFVAPLAAEFIRAADSSSRARSAPL